MVILSVVGGLISWALMLVFIGSADWTSFARTPGTTDLLFDGGMIGRMLVVSFVATLLTTAMNLDYFVLQWSSGARATLGMRLLGLQLGNAADGRTLDRRQAFRRWAAMGDWASILTVVPVIGGLVSLAQLAWYLALLITTANNPRRQGLHDQYAGTAVVQPAGKSNNGLVVGCIALLVIVFVVLPLISIVALLFLGFASRDHPLDGRGVHLTAMEGRIDAATVRYAGVPERVVAYALDMGLVATASMTVGALV